MGLTRQGVIEQYSHCKKKAGAEISGIFRQPGCLLGDPIGFPPHPRGWLSIVVYHLCLLEVRVKHNNKKMSTQLRHKDIKKGLSVDYEGTCINICADPNRQQRFCLAGAVVMPFSVKNSATPVRVSPPLLGLTQFESWHRKW